MFDEKWVRQEPFGSVDATGEKSKAWHAWRRGIKDDAKTGHKGGGAFTGTGIVSFMAQSVMEAILADARARGVELDVGLLREKSPEKPYYEGTAWRMYQEQRDQHKRVFSKEQLDRMNRGSKYEFLVRKYAERQTGLSIQDEVNLTSVQYPFLRVSLDGVGVDHAGKMFVFEAKIQAYGSRKKGADYQKATGLALNANMSYWWQVTHQMFVSGAEYAYYCPVGLENERLVAAGVVEVVKKKGGKPGETEILPALEKDTLRGDIVYPILERVERPSDAFYAQYAAYLSFIHETYFAAEVPPPMVNEDFALQKEMAKKAAASLAVATGAKSVVETLVEARQAIEAEEAALKQRSEENKAAILDYAKTQEKVGGVIYIGDPTLMHLELIDKETKAIAYAKVLKEMEGTLDPKGLQIMQDLMTKHTKTTTAEKLKLVLM